MNAKTVIIAVVTSIAGYLIGSYVYKSFFGEKGEPFENILLSAAQELNKKLPMLVDNETQADSSLAGPGKRFTYKYTLVNQTKENIDTAFLRSNLTPGIVNNYRTSKEMKLFRENSVELHYVYYDKNKKYLIDIAALPIEREEK